MKRTDPPTQREAEDIANTGYVGGRLPETPDGTAIYAPREMEDGRWAVTIVSRMRRTPLPDMVLERDGKAWKVVRQKQPERREEVDPIALKTQQTSLALRDKQKESS